MACPSCGFSVLDRTVVPAPPHPELLVSGVPSDLEATEIRKVIDTADEHILVVEEEMARLQRALDEHSARRRELGEFRRKQSSAFSLFRKLPGELLEEIFLHCREGNFPRELRSDPKWILTRVCAVWRAAATSIPIAHRWRHVHLDIHVTDNSLRDYRGSFPMLETLNLSDGRFHVFLACPLLHQLTLPPHPRPTRMAFPWRQLKTCHFRAYPSSDILQILALTTTITEVSIRTTYRNWMARVHYRAPPVTSAPLNALVISSYNDGSVLEGLTAPALRRLVVENADKAASTAIIPLFLARSDCSLTHLALKQISIASTMLLEVLTLTPLLTHLVAEGTRDISDDFFSALTSERTGSLVPSLVSLSLSGDFAAANLLIVKMLRSRSSATGSGDLRVVRLVYGHKSSVVPCLDDLRKAGLDARCSNDHDPPGPFVDIIVDPRCFVLLLLSSEGVLSSDLPNSILNLLPQISKFISILDSRTRIERRLAPTPSVTRRQPAWLRVGALPPVTDSGRSWKPAIPSLAYAARVRHPLEDHAEYHDSEHAP
ncbi:hypothetical protein C8R46DRAFT_1224377 [Mycena filopes]|nr:hypothetical protein C8R46DRAFT_1224377 [Mycena filopes]